jgi:hypothetical protein
MEIKKTIKIPGYTLGINIKAVLKKREGTIVAGIGNKFDIFYAPFFDYDITDLKVLLPELAHLQANYLLSNMHLFRTGKGYHVITADLLKYDTWIEILDSSNCDPDYKRVPAINGKKVWILRVTPKKNGEPYYIGTIPGEQNWPQSTTLNNWLRLRGVPPEKITNGEYNSNLFMAQYEA